MVDNSNPQLYPSSKLSSSLDRVNNLQVSSLHHRHSAPSSYNSYRNNNSNSNSNSAANSSNPEHSHSHHHHHHRHTHHQEQRRQSLVEWLQYLILFIFTYLKILLVRFFPFSASILSHFIDIESVRSSEHQRAQQEQQQQQATRKLSVSQSQSRSPGPGNSSTNNNKSLVQSQTSTSSSVACSRPCCRSRSVSGSSETQQYSSIDDLVQDRYKAKRTLLLPFPFTIFPFSLVNLITGKLFSVNRLVSLSRLGRYYKTTVQMRERFRNMFRWRPTSTEELDQAEQKILSHLKCPYKGYYVDIGKGWDLDHVLMWTLEVPPKQGATDSADRTPLSSTPLSSTPLSSTPQQKTQPELNQFVPSQLQGLPLVMVHGFASGVALWSLNLDELSLHGKRHLFAFDLLGFAKSSRPKFTFPKFHGLTQLQQSKAEAEAMEEYLVDSIEKWRRAIGPPLEDKFVMLGHSFGGYLATAYALRYPDRVAHVILADPWGFPPDSHSRNMSGQVTSSRQLPFWLQFAGRLFLDILTPLAGLRAAGPWGPKIINTLRPDLKKKFSRLHGGDGTTRTIEGADNDADISSTSTDDGTGEAGEAGPNDMITNYIYHCNAQCRPSGEIAFKKLCTHTGWARMPMLERIIELEPHITLSFIYGSRSWIDRQSGFQAKYILATAANSDSALALPNPNSSSDDEDEEAERVNVHIMQGSGHHVYADNPDEFNQLVMDICTEIDLQMLQAAMEESGNELEWEDDDDSFLQQQIAASGTAGGGGGGVAGGLVQGTGGLIGGSTLTPSWLLENGGTENLVYNPITSNSSPSGNPGSPSSKLDHVPEEDSY